MTIQPVSSTMATVIFVVVCLHDLLPLPNTNNYTTLVTGKPAAAEDIRLECPNYSQQCSQYQDQLDKYPNLTWNPTFLEAATSGKRIIPVVQLSENSKFVLIHQKFRSLSYQNATAVCRKCGMQLVQIRGDFDLRSIMKGLRRTSMWGNDIAFWISGTDEGHIGEWAYGKVIAEDVLEFQSVVSLGPKSCKKVGGKDNLLVRLAADSGFNERVPIMWGVGPESGIMPDNITLICQYTMRTRCYDQSEEAKHWKNDRMKKQKLLHHLIKSQPEIFISSKQYTFQNALNLCANHSHTILDGHWERQQWGLLFNAWQRWMTRKRFSGISTGFWIGSNNFFNPSESNIDWEWLSDSLQKVGRSYLLSPEDIDHAIRCKNCGKCLALTALPSNEHDSEGQPTFSLQRVPCSLPQWTICRTLSNNSRIAIHPNLKERPIDITNLTDNSLTPEGVAWQKYEGKRENWTVERVAPNSKLVMFTKPPVLEYPWDRAAEECKQWGLQMAVIKGLLDIKNIEAYLKGYDVDHTISYWVAGSHDSIYRNWKLGSETFHYNAFWRLGPRTCERGLNPSSAVHHLILRWLKDELTKQMSLVMLDVSNSHVARLRKGVICQFRDASTVVKESDEEKDYQDMLGNRWLENDFLLDLSEGRQVFVGAVQRSITEAEQFCQMNSQHLLSNAACLKAREAEKLYTAWHGWLEQKGLSGMTSGFWGGFTNLFTPKCQTKWEWVNDTVVSPVVFDWEKTRCRRDALKDWNCRSCGKCLAFSILDTKSKTFGLQKVMCDIPQWTLCISELEETVVPDDSDVTTPSPSSDDIAVTEETPAVRETAVSAAENAINGTDVADASVLPTTVMPVSFDSAEMSDSVEDMSSEQLEGVGMQSGRNSKKIKKAESAASVISANLEAHVLEMDYR